MFNGAYEDLNTDWYAGAGVYLTTVMLVNTFMPMLLTLGEWGIRRLQRRSALKGKVIVSIPALARFVFQHLPLYIYIFVSGVVHYSASDERRLPRPHVCAGSEVH